jgi:predicted site-specific integrase-resolvase
VGTSLEDRATTVAPDEAARRLGVEPSTLANWRWSGNGPRFVKVGGRVRYRLADLADYLDGQVRSSTSDPGPRE